MAKWKDDISSIVRCVLVAERVAARGQLVYEGQTFRVQLKTSEAASVRDEDHEDVAQKPVVTDGDDKLALEVTGIPEMTSEGFLKLYFESSKHCGGDAVHDIQYDRETGTALIYFEDRKGM